MIRVMLCALVVLILLNGCATNQQQYTAYAESQSSNILIRDIRTNISRQSTEVAGVKVSYLDIDNSFKQPLVDVIHNRISQQLPPGDDAVEIEIAAIMVTTSDFSFDFYGPNRRQQNRAAAKNIDDLSNVSCQIVYRIAGEQYIEHKSGLTRDSDIEQMAINVFLSTLDSIAHQVDNGQLLLSLNRTE